MKNKKIFAKFRALLLITVLILPPSQVFAQSTTKEQGGFYIFEDDGTLLSGPKDDFYYLNADLVAKKFYSLQGDQYDFLSIFTSVPLASPQGTLVKNKTKGIGLERNLSDDYDLSSQYGTSGYLKQVTELSFNQVYENTDPEFVWNLEFGDLLHEIIHYWGAYIGSEWDLLDHHTKSHYQPSGHIQFFDGKKQSSAVDTGGDILGGERLAPIGDGSFYQSTLLSGGSGHRILSPLTLYEMGLISKNEVPPITVVRTGPSGELTNEARQVSMDEIIRLYGERSPSYRNSQKDFSAAFILVVKKGEKPDQFTLWRMNNVVKNFPFYWARKTRCLSSLSTNLEKSNPLRCNPLSPSKSEVITDTIVKTGTRTTIKVKVRDAVGAPLPGRAVDLYPLKASPEVTPDQLHYHFSQEMPSRFIYNKDNTVQSASYFITDERGEVDMSVMSSADGSYQYIISVDGEVLDDRPIIAYQKKLAADKKVKIKKGHVIAYQKKLAADKKVKIKKGHAVIDQDNDGLPDTFEKRIGTNPKMKDTDRDGHDDFAELKNGYNPRGKGKWKLPKQFLAEFRTLLKR